MLVEALGFFNLLCAGLLAGEEFVIRYGVRGPLAQLDAQPSIQLRQTLILKLRILVPAMFGLTLVSAIAVTALAGTGPGFGLRCVGIAALLTFIVITLAGTVPINQAALTWDAAAPPDGWRASVRRWEQLDTLRTWAALAAFGFLLAAAVLR